MTVPEGLETDRRPAERAAPAHSVSPAWLDDDLRHVWHPYTQMKTAPPPLPVERAEGVFLHLSDGRRILDGISSWWVNLHGHNHPRLNRALAEQAGKLAQVIFAGFTSTFLPNGLSSTRAKSSRAFAFLALGASM